MASNVIGLAFLVGAWTKHSRAKESDPSSEPSLQSERLLEAKRDSIVAVRRMPTGRRNTDVFSDSRKLLEHLAVRGFSNTGINQTARSLIDYKYDAKRAKLIAQNNADYWKKPPRLSQILEEIRREEQIERRELLGTSWSAKSDPERRKELERRFGNYFSEEKFALLCTLEGDYNEMMQVSHDALSKSGRDLIMANRQADIAALLSPAELREYELRTSPLAKQLASEIAEINISEAQFRELYLLKRALYDRNIDQAAYEASVMAVLGPVNVRALEGRESKERNDVKRVGEKAK